MKRLLPILFLAVALHVGGVLAQPEPALPPHWHTNKTELDQITDAGSGAIITTGERQTVQKAVTKDSTRTINVSAGEGALQTAWDSIEPVVAQLDTVTLDLAGGVYTDTGNQVLEAKGKIILGGVVIQGSGYDDGTATGGGNDYLDDTSKSWTPNEWANAWVLVFKGTGRGQFRQISSNTATRLNVSSTWATNPASGSSYAVYSTVIDGEDARVPVVVNGVKNLTIKNVLVKGTPQNWTAQIEMTNRAGLILERVAWGNPSSRKGLGLRPQVYSKVELRWTIAMKNQCGILANMQSQIDISLTSHFVDCLKGTLMSGGAFFSIGDEGEGTQVSDCDAGFNISGASQAYGLGDFVTFNNCGTNVIVDANSYGYSDY